MKDREQEPVAWHAPGAYGNVTVYEKWAKENGWLPLYTAPQQREWQGLTGDEILLLAADFELITFGAQDLIGFVREVEAKLKEKNT